MNELEEERLRVQTLQAELKQAEAQHEQDQQDMAALRAEVEELRAVVDSSALVINDQTQIVAEAQEENRALRAKLAKAEDALVRALEEEGGDVVVGATWDSLAHEALAAIREEKP